MPSTELLVAFLATTAMFSLIPGPALFYVMAQTMAGGRLSGLMATLGIHLGGYAHVAAAAAGLSVLFHAVPPLYWTVKLAGAAYLLWLGVSMIRAKSAGAEPLEGAKPPEMESKSGRRAFVESVTVEILNPKTALFFMALLPQFVDASARFPVWLQFALLGTFVNVMFGLVDVVCVLLAGVVLARLKGSSRAQRLMRRTGGAILVGLGTHLVLQRS